MENNRQDRRHVVTQPTQFGQYRPPERSSHPKKTRKLFITGLCILVLVGAGSYLLLRPSGKKQAVEGASTHTASTVSKHTAAPPASQNAALATMAQNINGVISQNSNIDISVNLINLDNGQAEHYGTNDTFQAASTAKIITAACWLHEVEDGQQSMSETVGGETPQYELQQMIVVSDDTAWSNLNTTIGYTNLQNYADSLGVTQYQAYNNSLTSGDIALVLQKLWAGKLLNKSDTQMILSYMKEANYREYLVPAIPSDDVIYHKIGLYEDYVNDAAIVTHDNQAFVVVVFTNGNGAYNWPARADMMQDIAKAALRYYFNQSGATVTAAADSSTTT
jgi:beta-lactamase class A